MAGTSRPPLSAAAAADTCTGCTSASTLSATTTTGSHVLTVIDYSRDKELHAAGQRVLSETRFTVGGYSWRLTFSPYGFTGGTQDWICFGLCFDPPPFHAGEDIDDVRVQTSYSMLDHAGQPVPSSVTEEDERDMSTMKSWSFTLFMKRERFESIYVKDIGFCVRCDVTLVRRTSVIASGDAMSRWEDLRAFLIRVMPPLDDLGRQLGDLLATGIGTDVTLEVGGEEFPAHRSVLAARSPLFKAKLFGGRHDEDAAPVSHLRIHGIEPSQFRVLLHFIYTDSLPTRW